MSLLSLRSPAAVRATTREVPGPVCRRAAAVFAVAGLVAFAASAPAAAGSRGTDAVSVWNANAGKAAVAACISPVGPSPAEARLYAMTHIAIHDALNAISRRSEPYAYDARARHNASPDAAVAAAAHDVLVPLLGQLSTLVPPACIDAAVAGVEADYTAALAAVRDGKAKKRGLAVGQAAAAAILALRAGDGAQELTVGDPAYVEGTEPGEYRFTPGTPFAFAPRLGELTPFVLRSASQFRPGPPHLVTDSRYTADFNEVKGLGGDVVTTPSARTPDQTQIALFWVESSPLQWNRIARTVAASAGLDAWEQARLFGLLNMALTDGYTGTFEAKYLYKYWRPVTAIRLAASDGNPDTAADPTWTPLVETPPIPDYDSGHAVEGGAAAAVLAEVLRAGPRDVRLLQHDAPGREPVRPGRAGRARVLELLPGGGGERALAHPRRVPLPRGGRGRDRARRQDRPARGQPLHGAGPPRARPWRSPLADQERVPVRVAQDEHGRRACEQGAAPALDRIALPEDRVVHADALLLELGVRGVDVVDGPREPRLDPGWRLVRRLHERDRRLRPRRDHLDPPLPLRVLEVHAGLEPEHVHVERQRGALVAHWDVHRRRVRDLGHVGASLVVGHQRIDAGGGREVIGGKGRHPRSKYRRWDS